MTAAGDKTLFDGLAAEYDESFSNRLPARWLRDRVRDRVAALLPGESHILDIGCGTGEDAAWFADDGHRIVATDVSEAMCKATRDRRDSLPDDVRARISVGCCDAARNLPEGSFDLAFSNFGALNCIADLSGFFDQIDARVRPGGVVALVVMGPFCLWETLGFALRGRFRKAARRWRRSARFEVDGAQGTIWYHAPSQIWQCAQPLFHVVEITGVGVFVPSTEFFGICERWPRLFSALAVLERLLAGRWPFDRMGDHYLIVLRKSKNGGV